MLGMCCSRPRDNPEGLRTTEVRFAAQGNRQSPHDGNQSELSVAYTKYAEVRMSVDYFSLLTIA